MRRPYPVYNFKNAALLVNNKDGNAIPSLQLLQLTASALFGSLNFIRNSDKILVLNTGGTINAFDTPDNLLKDTDGYFAKQLAEENQSM